jgi:hypothetical protein
VKAKIAAELAALKAYGYKRAAVILAVGFVLGLVI